ncbi:zf-CCHC domain-containing protein [Tanacetum coccineum]
MDSDKYLEGQSMQRPPLFESDHFIYWKNRFETYVKAKDLDLWHIILNGDFPPVARNKETQVLETVPFEQQDDDLKKKLAKNNEAKMVLYNALPKKEYERIFMCKTAKDIWQSLLITHQGNSQVKDNKIDLLVQQYEQFTILEEESIDSGFARFNTIITSLKALDEGFSSKNYVRKFLRALHPKWRAKVTAIEESKDLSSLALDELIGNLKVHEVVMEKDSEIYRGKKERVKSIALKAKKESSDDETSTSGSDDEEYAMAVRNFKKFFRRKGKFVRQPREEKKSFRQRDKKKGKSDQKCFRCGDPNHLIGDCPKPSRNKDQKAFIGGSWSDSKNDAEDKTNDETCLMAQSSNEVTLNSSHYSDNASSLDNDSMQIEYDSLCEISLKIINKNKILKTKRDLLEKEILELNEKIKKLKRSKEIEIACKSCEELKSENAKLKETQVKFDKSANSLREMLNNQKLPSCKIGLGFDDSKASTSGTKNISFVGSSVEKATNVSTIKVNGSTLHGSVSRTYGEKGTEHVFSLPMSSRSDFVITRKKLIHNSIDESKKPSLKPSPKSGVCLKTCLELDEWIKDSGCSKHMTGNKSLFSTYKAYDGVHQGDDAETKFGVWQNSKPTKTPMSMEIKLTKDDEADSVDSSKYQDYYSDNQYAVSIKEDTAYPCLHSPKTTKEEINTLDNSIRRIHFHWIWRIQLSVQYSVLIQLINTAYPLPLDTAYRSSGTETES